MLRLLLALTLTAVAQPAHAAETCPPIERIAGPPVYVILHGYSQSTRAGLKRLAQVDDDLVNMTRFFRALGPAQMHVHGEPTPWLHNRLGETRQPATWRALLGSVARVIDDIRRRPPSAKRPQVYVYFAGHGTPGTRDRLDLFSTPEAGADGPGYDGEIDSKLIADHIIGPLSAHADLHLIADTCFSYHLIQIRSTYSREKIAPQPPRELAYLYDFTAEYPTAGALLATRELTHESGDYGGLFSHLVRSLSIGMADVDRDGIITYGEMARAFPEIAPPSLTVPEVVAPSLDPERPFIDWRGTPAARVCLPDDIRGKRILIDYKALFATLNLAGEPTPVWLPPGRTLGLTTWGVEGRYFRAVDGPADFDVRSPRLTPTTEPGGSALTAGAPGDTTQVPPPPSPTPTASDPQAPDAEPMPYWEPLPMLFAEPLTTAPVEAQPPVALTIPVSVGAAALVGASVAQTSLGDIALAPHVDLAGRVGYAQHRFLAQAGYAWWTYGGPNAVQSYIPAEITGHRLGGRVGYGRLTSTGAAEVSIDLLGGAFRLWNADANGPGDLDVGELAVRR